MNALGIGAQGLGGLSTVLDVKIRTYPVHAANRPVAIIPNCAATRHAASCSTGPARGIRSALAFGLAGRDVDAGCEGKES